VYSSQSRGVYPAPRGTAYARVAPRYYPSRGINVAPRRFYSPYYSFRPRFSLGFGLWVGYPVTYSYPYYYGYPYYGGYSYYGSPYYGSAYYGDPYYDVYPYGSAGSSYGQYYPPSIREYSAGPSSTYPPANYPPASAPQSGSYGPDPGTGSIVAPPGASSGGVSFEISPSTAEVYIDGKYAGRVSDLGPTTQPMALTTGRHHVEIRATGYQTMSFDADVSTGQVIPYQGTMQRER
jgi:hypothetical protein